MNDPVQQPPDATAPPPASAPTASEDPPPPAPAEQLCVGWLAGADTLEHFGVVVQPLAVGLMDELVDLVVFRPDQGDGEEGPSVVAAEAVAYEPAGWMRRRKTVAAELAEEVVRRKLRVLHALDVSAAPLAAAVAKRAGVPLVVSACQLGLRGRAARACRKAAVVLAADDTVARDLTGRLRCEGERVVVVRPAVHPVRRPRCFRDPRYRAALVTGGDLEDMASLAAVVRSFAELNDRNYECAYFLAGGGRAEGRLRALAESLGLRGALQFVEPQTPRELGHILREADVYIAPAPTVRVDLPSLVALSAGVPVLAAEGVLGDFLVDGETVMRFAPGDSAELTMKLLSLLDDRPAARALAEHALVAVRHTHSPAQMAATTAAVYRRVAGAASG